MVQIKYSVDKFYKAIQSSVIRHEFCKVDNIMNCIIVYIKLFIIIISYKWVYKNKFMLNCWVKII